jgi:plastocyanin
MSNKALYVIVAVLILVGLGFILYNNQRSPELESTEQSTPQVNQEPSNNSSATPATPTTPSTPPATGGQFSDESDAGGGSDVQVREVVYNGTSYSPAELSIKVGDVVVFKNASTKAFWPASAPHPQHTNYPEFDPKRAIAAGGSWEFKFLKAGTWPYHDHLTPTVFGRIVVAQ